MTDFVDHLIVFSPDLEQGREWVRQRLGTRPVPGGRHPDLGTHNALLGLGPSCYLEVMAPDPAAERPADLSRLPIGPVSEPRLGTWVLRADDIEESRRRADDVGLGSLRSGCRDNPDGTRLRWRLTSPFAFPFDGVVPFLIDWGDSPHPGTVLPRAGRLLGLRLSHPDPAGVEKALEALGAAVPVHRGRTRIEAMIETDLGPVTIG